MAPDKYTDVGVVRYYPENTVGRDFVVGDLHGCYETLMYGLKHLNFDPEVDRVFAVGDLIDRGPHSYETVELLSTTWFDSVIGNHEEMMIEALEEVSKGDFFSGWHKQWMDNGGKWSKEYMRQDPKKLFALCNTFLINMPVCIVVGKGTASRFNIVHAELFGRASKLINDEVIDTIGFDFIDKHDTNSPKICIDGALWGRQLRLFKKVVRNMNLLQNEHKGLSTTFVGHTPSLNVERIGVHIFIDTGCCFAGAADTPHGLTIANPKDGTYINVNPYRPTPVFEGELPKDDC